jgi:hypothetical protein
VNVILDDLTQLTPKRLERRLEELARDALPCLDVTVFDGNPVDGLTVGLRIDAQERRDVLDLVRVLESEPVAHVASAWALLEPRRHHPLWRLLLRIDFQRPVRCSFVIRFDVRAQSGDPLGAKLPLLLAADRFALALDRSAEYERPVSWVAAPASRECVLEVLAQLTH